MSYQHERDRFVARMANEGLPFDATLRLLRAATTLQRYAELACSSEAADRDRVPCPATRNKTEKQIIAQTYPCLCDYSGDHQDVPRIAVQEARLITRITAAMPAGWTINVQGDPRGYVLRVIPPSYAERNVGRDRFNLDTIGVPSAPSRLQF